MLLQYNATRIIIVHNSCANNRRYHAEASEHNMDYIAREDSNGADLTVARGYGFSYTYSLLFREARLSLRKLISQGDRVKRNV